MRSYDVEIVSVHKRISQPPPAYQRSGIPEFSPLSARREGHGLLL